MGILLHRNSDKQTYYADSKNSSFPTNDHATAGGREELTVKSFL